MVFPCAFAPLPSPELMGNYGEAQRAGSYRCRTPVMRTNE